MRWRPSKSVEDLLNLLKIFKNCWRSSGTVKEVKGFRVIKGNKSKTVLKFGIISSETNLDLYFWIFCILVFQDFLIFHDALGCTLDTWWSRLDTWLSRLDTKVSRVDTWVSNPGFLVLLQKMLHHWPNMILFLYPEQYPWLFATLLHYTWSNWRIVIFNHGKIRGRQDWNNLFYLFWGNRD